MVLSPFSGQPCTMTWANTGQNAHRHSCLVVVFSVIVRRRWRGERLAPDSASPKLQLAATPGRFRGRICRAIMTWKLLNGQPINRKACSFDHMSIPRFELYSRFYKISGINRVSRVCCCLVIQSPTFRGLARSLTSHSVSGSRPQKPWWMLCCVGADDLCTWSVVAIFVVCRFVYARIMDLMGMP